MSQLLPPFSIFDFTPPSSPTKLSQTMKWLRRTPSSVPLPPSPTKSRDTSDDDDSQPIFSADSATLAESSITEAMGSLHKKSSAFTLQLQSIPSPLPTTPLSSPQREASRWLSRPSPSRTWTSTRPASELGDHFTRSPPTQGEKESKLPQRREASQQRVNRLRSWLSSTSTAPRDEMCNSAGKSARTHQRFDSGTHEVADLNDVAALDIEACEDATQTPTPTQSPLQEEELLRFSLFRLQSLAVRDFDCVGCKTSHSGLAKRRGPVVWLLYGCRHVVHSACLRELRDVDGSGQHGGCGNCAYLAGVLGRCSVEELEARQERVLRATGAVPRKGRKVS